jgi:hypothetical protein
MMNKKPNLDSTFTFRIPLARLRAAQRKASKQGTFLASVVRRLVYEYEAKRGKETQGGN